MKNKYSSLNHLLLTVLFEDFTVLNCKPVHTNHDLKAFVGEIYLPDRNFTITYELVSIMLIIRSIPSVRILTTDFPEVKQVFDRMKIEAERGVL